uniref:Uncharacterized protein n=1 Tax=Callorhinchus milii TaxID=7868 RepID=A0A4W3GMS1_CALMI
MVNPERRASIEDVSSHWWVNWGYKTPVGEVEGPGVGLGVGECGSPLLHGSAWLHRSARSLLESGSRLRGLFKPGGSGLERQRSLKKSKKENDISQSLQEGGTSPDSPTKSILKRPKGILKKRSNGEHHRGHGTPHPAPHQAPDSPDDSVFLPQSRAAFGESLPTAPRKGILKKPPQRESGYYSSPEPSDCSEPLDGEGMGGGDGARSPHPVGSAPAAFVPGFPARKGILKHHSKYSSRSSTDSALGSPSLRSFGSFDDLVFLAGPSAPPGRPTSAISEDSILSSESFDRLDLPDSPREREREPGRMRGCVSADDLLGLGKSQLEFRSRLCKIKCFEELGADSPGSLMDLDNVTDVYKKAVQICHKLG